MPSDDLGLIPVRRALFSVADKSGLIELGRTLQRFGTEIVATGRTHTALTEAGVPARLAEELTGIGTWFGGRIKTLHPALLGGILAPRTPEGEAELSEHRLVRIDLVVVNFYPFARHERESPGSADREELIDIGGVTLARAAAKNHASVTIASDPSDYPLVLHELETHRGAVSEKLRRTLAQATFARCSAYDAAIARALSGEAVGALGFPEELSFQRDSLNLRYGENPHQTAAAYHLTGPGQSRLSPMELKILKGSGLSYTNLLDLDNALGIVNEFPTPTAAVVKHATPCGVASGATVRETLERAIATDPVARYGCIIGVNRAFGPEDVDSLHGIFVDLLAAPRFEPPAVERLSRRTKIKLVEATPPDGAQSRWEAHTAMGRLMIQEADQRQLAPNEFRLVTSHAATPHQACALDFAWRVVRHAKSNAAVLAQGSAAIGIGSGQTTRVKAVELALEVAGPRAQGAVLASDGFFPFADGVQVAGKAGVAAIIQPGGSIRDPEVIAAAERFRIAMYFSGWRVFRH